MVKGEPFIQNRCEFDDLESPATDPDREDESSFFRSRIVPAVYDAAMSNDEAEAFLELHGLLGGTQSRTPRAWKKLSARRIELFKLDMAPALEPLRQHLECAGA